MKHTNELWDRDEKALDAMQHTIRNWRFGKGGFYLDMADFLEATLDNVAPGMYPPTRLVKKIAKLLRRLSDE